MTTTIQNLATRQTMLCFSFLAYSGEELTTTNPGPTILGYINQTMPNMPPLCVSGTQTPDWAVVWGPAVYTTPGAMYQDNLIFLARRLSDPTQVVLAIRGTNFVAQLDWLMDDLDIIQQMPWPPGSTATTGGAMISESTSITLQLLLTMTDSTGKTALQALQTLSTGAAIQLCVTGHSLGGCMSGTLAFYLDSNHALWDTAGGSIVSCVTFAGPTAGNAAFAAASDANFSNTSVAYPTGWDSTLGTRCDAVRCNYDVAPEMWIASNISNSKQQSPLFETYGSNINFSNLSWSQLAAWVFFEQDILPYVADLLAKGGYTQIVSGAAELQGTFNGTPPPNQDSTFMIYMQAFIEQAAWQHGNSYPNALSLTGLYDLIIRNTTTSDSTGVRQKSAMAAQLAAKLAKK